MKINEIYINNVLSLYQYSSSIVEIAVHVVTVVVVVVVAVVVVTVIVVVAGR